VAIIAGCTASLTWLLRDAHDAKLFTSLRYSFFRVATSLTSTGFGIDDHKAYPPGAVAIVLLMMLVGGCAGSTAGGMKVSRVLILAKATIAQVRRSVRPAVVTVVRVDQRPVQPSIVVDVLTFFVIYMACLVGFSMAVIVTDNVSVPTALGAVLSCLSNMGPAPFYVDVDNFQGWTGTAKLVFCAAMVLGRLEFFTVLAVFLPEVWRR
jgi:trk system potassium uptake protein TrkH